MASPDPHPLCGYYYGTYDGCLHHISWYQDGYYQARCPTPAPTPAEDVFGPPYATTEAQLRWLLAFGCFEPAIC